MRALLSGLIGIFFCLNCHAQHSGLIAPEYDALLEKIVNINTDATNQKGLDEVRALLIPLFETLGFKSTTIDLANGHRLVSMEMPGSKPSILMIGHIDTVFPASGKFLQMRREEGKYVGPGVIDMKGGIVLMLNALADLKKENRTVLSQIRVIINDDEEITSPYSKTTLRKLAQGLKYGLVFETGLEDGALVKGEAGLRWYKLTVRGKASHAGLEPQNGINACIELGHKLTKIATLSRLDAGLSVNPGLIEGGIKPNVVCEQATATIDVRFQRESDLTQLEEQLEGIRANSTVFNKLLNEGTKSEMKLINSLPLLPEERARDLASTAQEIAKSLGQDVPARVVGYGSDANHLADTGIELLIGLGLYGGGMHTDHEFMDVTSYPKRLALAKGLLVKLGERAN